MTSAGVVRDSATLSAFAFASTCANSTGDAFGRDAAIDSSSTLLTTTCGSMPADRKVASRAGEREARTTSVTAMTERVVLARVRKSRCSPRTGARMDGAPHHRCPVRPVARWVWLLRLHRGQAREHGHHDGEFLLGRVAGEHVECDFLNDRTLACAHSGMFPCFLGGPDARLPRRARKARTNCSRVSCGRITRST